MVARVLRGCLAVDDTLVIPARLVPGLKALVLKEFEDLTDSEHGVQESRAFSVYRAITGMAYPDALKKFYPDEYQKMYGEEDCK